MFQVGQKVRCVNPDEPLPKLGVLEKGRTYTVKKIHGEKLELEEMPGCLFFAHRFLAVEVAVPVEIAASV